MVPKVAIIPLSFSVEFVKESEMVKESWVSGKMLLPLSKDDSPLTFLKIKLLGDLRLLVKCIFLQSFKSAIS